MKIKHSSLALSILLLFPYLCYSEERNATQLFTNDMLPKGHWGVRIEGRFGEADSKLDEHGEEVNFNEAISGINIDATLLPTLALFGPGASLGTTDIHSEISGQRQTLTIGYGLSDTLTIGIKLPQEKVHHKVDIDLQPGNLSVNPAFDPTLPLDVTNAPFLPVGTPGSNGPATVDEVSAILTDPYYGYEYKPLGSVTTQGMLDPSIGLRWLLYQDANQSWIVTPTWRFGMTEKNDPDDLFDLHLENGTDAFSFDITHVRNLDQHFDVRLSFKHTHQFADKRMARARASGETLVPVSRKERLDFKPGYKQEAFIELGYRQGNWRYKTQLLFANKTSDDWSSPSGQDVTGLEENTDFSAHFAWLGVSWSGIKPWQEGKLPLPLILTLDVRTLYDGYNVVKSDDLYLTATALF